MVYKIRLEGLRFCRLFVLKEVEVAKPSKTTWLCECECGKQVTATTSALRGSHKRSCGCLKSPEYQAWSNMKARCTNPSTPNFKDYGGRGISVCDRWFDSFELFLADMGRRPTPDHSLDRFPDTNGNYEPPNCRWAVEEQQKRNTRRNKWIEYNGEKMILKDWAIKLGIDDRRLCEQLKTKSFEDAIHFLRFIKKPGRKSGKENGNAKKVGMFKGNELVKEYFPINEVLKDGFNVNSIYTALSKGTLYKKYQWKHIDEPNKKAA
jgi:hypothetical protein